MRGRRIPIAGALVALALALGAAASDAAKDDTVLVSRATGAAGVAAGGDASRPAISGDGRRVVFESTAANLDPADTDTVGDVFVRDVETGTTTLVSRATGAGGAKGGGESLLPAISADGRFVSFGSYAPNLDPADTDIIESGDVFVRNLLAGTTTLVSRASGATGLKGDDDSFASAISPDGRYVAFESAASNLDPAHTGRFSFQVYLRDRLMATTTLVSRATGANGSGADGDSYGTAMSDDGQRIAFGTYSDELDPADGDIVPDVYVRDVAAGTTTLVSRASGAVGAKANGATADLDISGDGRYVAFDALASNLDPADGDATRDVYVRDLQTATTTLVSRASGAAGQKGDGDSSAPEISGDGRYVTFASSAKNLDPADTDELVDVFVRDLQSGTTTLVSRATGAAGAKGDHGSTNPDVTGDGPAISADARFVAFSSAAANLDPADTDAAFDVFRRDVLGPPAAPPPPPPPGGEPVPADPGAADPGSAAIGASEAPAAPPSRFISIRTSGTIVAPRGIPRRRACPMTVSLTLMRYGRVLARRSVHASSTCRWSATFRVSRASIGRARTLTLRERWRGNRYVKPRLRVRSVRVPS